MMAEPDPEQRAETAHLDGQLAARERTIAVLEDARDTALWLHAESGHNLSIHLQEDGADWVQLHHALGAADEEGRDEVIDRAGKLRADNERAWVRAERLQARIDEALTHCAGHTSEGYAIASRVRAALQGGQPTESAEVPEIRVHRSECTDERCTRIDGRCVGYHCDHCGKPCGMYGHERCRSATSPQASPPVEPSGEAVAKLDQPEVDR